MKANISLNSQILGYLYSDFDSRSASGSLDITFHAELEENGYHSGYEQLHGTDSTLGDFHIGGNAGITYNGGTKIGNYATTLTWHDTINPNLTYTMDGYLSNMAYRIFTPADYTVAHTWQQTYG